MSNRDFKQDNHQEPLAEPFAERQGLHEDVQGGDAKGPAAAEPVGQPERKVLVVDEAQNPLKDYKKLVVERRKQGIVQAAQERKEAERAAAALLAAGGPPVDGPPAGGPAGDQLQPAGQEEDPLVSEAFYLSDLEGSLDALAQALESKEQAAIVEQAQVCVAKLQSIVQRTQDPRLLAEQQTLMGFLQGLLPAEPAEAKQPEVGQPAGVAAAPAEEALQPLPPSPLQTILLHIHMILQGIAKAKQAQDAKAVLTGEKSNYVKFQQATDALRNDVLRLLNFGGRGVGQEADHPQFHANFLKNVAAYSAFNGAVSGTNAEVCKSLVLNDLVVLKAVVEVAQFFHHSGCDDQVTQDHVRRNAQGVLVFAAPPAAERPIDLSQAFVLIGTMRKTIDDFEEPDARAELNDRIARAESKLQPDSKATLQAKATARRELQQYQAQWQKKQQCADILKDQLDKVQRFIEVVVGRELAEQVGPLLAQVGIRVNATTWCDLINVISKGPADTVVRLLGQCQSYLAMTTEQRAKFKIRTIADLLVFPDQGYRGKSTLSTLSLPDRQLLERAQRTLFRYFSDEQQPFFAQWYTKGQCTLPEDPPVAAVAAAIVPVDITSPTGVFAANLVGASPAEAKHKTGNFGSNDISRLFDNIKWGEFAFPWPQQICEIKPFIAANLKFAKDACLNADGTIKPILRQAIDQLCVRTGYSWDEFEQRVGVEDSRVRLVTAAAASIGMTFYDPAGKFYHETAPSVTTMYQQEFKPILGQLQTLRDVDRYVDLQQRPMVQDSPEKRLVLKLQQQFMQLVGLGRTDPDFKAMFIEHVGFNFEAMPTIALGLWNLSRANIWGEFDDRGPPDYATIYGEMDNEAGRGPLSPAFAQWVETLRDPRTKKLCRSLIETVTQFKILLQLHEKIYTPISYQLERKLVDGVKPPAAEQKVEVKQAAGDPAGDAGVAHPHPAAEHAGGEVKLPPQQPQPQPAAATAALFAAFAPLLTTLGIAIDPLDEKASPWDLQTAAGMACFTAENTARAVNRAVLEQLFTHEHGREEAMVAFLKNCENYLSAGAYDIELARPQYQNENGQEAIMNAEEFKKHIESKMVNASKIVIYRKNDQWYVCCYYNGQKQHRLLTPPVVLAEDAKEILDNEKFVLLQQITQQLSLPSPISNERRWPIVTVESLKSNAGVAGDARDPDKPIFETAWRACCDHLTIPPDERLRFQIRKNKGQWPAQIAEARRIISQQERASRYAVLQTMGIDAQDDLASIVATRHKIEQLDYWNTLPKHYQKAIIAFYPLLQRMGLDIHGSTPHAQQNMRYLHRLLANEGVEVGESIREKNIILLLRQCQNFFSMPTHQLPQPPITTLERLMQDGAVGDRPVDPAEQDDIDRAWQGFCKHVLNRENAGTYDFPFYVLHQQWRSFQDTEPLDAEPVVEDQPADAELIILGEAGHPPEQAVMDQTLAWLQDDERLRAQLESLADQYQAKAITFADRAFIDAAGADKNMVALAAMGDFIGSLPRADRQALGGDKQMMRWMLNQTALITTKVTGPLMTETAGGMGKTYRGKHGHPIALLADPARGSRLSVQLARGTDRARTPELRCDFQQNFEVRDDNKPVTSQQAGRGRASFPAYRAGVHVSTRLMRVAQGRGQGYRYQTVLAAQLGSSLSQDMRRRGMNDFFDTAFGRVEYSHAYGLLTNQAGVELGHFAEDCQAIQFLLSRKELLQTPDNRNNLTTLLRKFQMHDYQDVVDQRNRPVAWQQKREQLLAKQNFTHLYETSLVGRPSDSRQITSIQAIAAMDASALQNFIICSYIALDDSFRDRLTGSRGHRRNPKSLAIETMAQRAGDLADLAHWVAELDRLHGAGRASEPKHYVPVCSVICFNFDLLASRGVLTQAIIIDFIDKVFPHLPESLQKYYIRNITHMNWLSEACKLPGLVAAPVQAPAMAGGEIAVPPPVARVRQAQPVIAGIKDAIINKLQEKTRFWRQAEYFFGDDPQVLFTSTNVTEATVRQVADDRCEQLRKQMLGLPLDALPTPVQQAALHEKITAYRDVLLPLAPVVPAPVAVQPQAAPGDVRDERAIQVMVQRAINNPHLTRAEAEAALLAMVPNAVSFFGEEGGEEKGPAAEVRQAGRRLSAELDAQLARDPSVIPRSDSYMRRAQMQQGQPGQGLDRTLSRANLRAGPGFLSPSGRNLGGVLPAAGPDLLIPVGGAGMRRSPSGRVE